MIDIFISSETYRIDGDHLVFNAINPVLEKLKEKDYGTEFVDIGIIPVIMPTDWHDAYKERVLLKRKAKEADIRLYIDYNKYLKADKNGRILLFWQTIIKSIKAINDRKKGDFAGDRLVDDLLLEIGMSIDELNAI